MTRDTAIIHGTGLIGASIGLALRSAGWVVTGWDPDPAALAIAIEREAVDRTIEDPLGGMDLAHLVVLAGPPSATIETLGSLSTNALVTDVAGVKAQIVEAAGHLSHFVGGHPMAGRTRGGAALASADLFRGAAWILTIDGTEPDDIDRMGAIVESFGARPIVMSAREHDYSVAHISHLPHIIAATLIDLAQGDPQAFTLAAGSFRDLTRVAASDPTWWTDVLSANAEQVEVAIEAIERRLEVWRKALRARRSEDIGKALYDAQKARLRLGPDVARVRVPLVDQPGELARVGRALQRSAVDVRDLQLRHAEHGGGGLLTLAVYAREAHALRTALIEEGFSPDAEGY